MSAPDFAAVGAVYERHWEHAEILPARLPAIEAAARRVLEGKQRYQAIEDHTGIPWALVGCLHLREADCNFHCHLHNGDPLSARTYHVPAGRPVKGNAPFTWEGSAIDALTMAPHEMDRITQWPVARVAYEAEKYNGWGYYLKGRLSPYDWSGETEDGQHEMATGKYVRDHVFDPSVIDRQPGVMSVLKVLIQMDPSIKFFDFTKANTSVPASPPAPAQPKPRKIRRAHKAAAGVVIAAGTAATHAKAFPMDTHIVLAAIDFAAGLVTGLLLGAHNSGIVEKAASGIASLWGKVFKKAAPAPVAPVAPVAPPAPVALAPAPAEPAKA